ncbi:MAG: hypothetical protein WC498_04045 [Candidatus Saccharimonadales bacterium]
MYQLGKRARHHQLLIVAGVLLVLGGISFGTYKLLHLTLSPLETITNPPASTTPYSPEKLANSFVNETYFTTQLPFGWKRVSFQTSPNIMYTYQGGKANTQILSIYIDNLPTTLAVNRVLPLEVQGGRLVHGTLSDNCVDFLSPSILNTPQAQTKKVVDAKWQNVEFYCDIGNFQRNVTGTSSEAGINKLVLGGSTTGAHNVFFTYTDNGSSPDYSVFYSVLDSFKLK